VSALQTIIDSANKIEIDRRRIVGQSVSRSQRLRTAERTSSQPWMMSITPKPAWTYSTNRELIEGISYIDRSRETQINLANNPNLAYLTAYQGDMTAGQITAVRVTATSTATITLDVLPSIDSTAYLFRSGDFIQPQYSRYPYTVVDSVQRGLGSTAVINLNRPIITSENLTLTGSGVLVGNSCSWRMIVGSLPTIQMTIRDRFEWSGDFKLMEKVI
jgi:hypothetical protein